MITFTLIFYIRLFLLMSSKASSTEYISSRFLYLFTSIGKFETICSVLGFKLSMHTLEPTLRIVRALFKDKKAHALVPSIIGCSTSEHCSFKLLTSIADPRFNYKGFGSIFSVLLNIFLNSNKFCLFLLSTIAPAKYAS